RHLPAGGEPETGQIGAGEVARQREQHRRCPARSGGGLYQASVAGRPPPPPGAGGGGRGPPGGPPAPPPPATPGPPPPPPPPGTRTVRAYRPSDTSSTPGMARAARNRSSDRPSNGARQANRSVSQLPSAAASRCAA